MFKTCRFCLRGTCRPGSPPRRSCLPVGRENAKVDLFQFSAPFRLLLFSTARETPDPSALFGFSRRKFDLDRNDRNLSWERAILSRLGRFLGSLPKAVFFNLLQFRIHQGKIDFLLPLLVSFFSLLLINFHRFF